MHETSNINSYTKNLIPFFCLKIRHSLDWGHSQNKKCLELFAKDGRLHTHFLGPFFQQIIGIDIEQSHAVAFESSISGARFLQGDSHKLLKDETWLPKKGFDLVSIDNPLGVFGTNSDYCEHFNILKDACSVVSRPGAIMFNVVTSPYDFDNPKNDEWIKRRKSFYKSSSARQSIFSLHVFYSNLFASFGRKLIELEFGCKEVYNDNPYFYLGLVLLE